MTSHDLERSNSSTQYAYSPISRKQLEMLLATIANQRVCREAARLAILATAWLLVDITWPKREKRLSTFQNDYFTG